MAKTARGTKWVDVKPYVKKDGTPVHGHDRSTPSNSTGKKPN